MVPAPIPARRSRLHAGAGGMPAEQMMTVKRAEVCIVGGGLMGAWSALLLRQRGKSVILVESGRIGRQASGVNFGNLRMQGRNPVEFPLSLRAHPLWEQSRAITGEDCGFTACGHAYLAFGPQDHPTLDRYAREAMAAGVDIERLDAADIGQRWPWLSGMVTGAIYSWRDAIADPTLAAPAVARAAARSGAKIVEDLRVTGILPGDGVHRVLTDGGPVIEAGCVVNAAGAWAAGFAAAAGEPVPLFAASPLTVETAPLPRLIEPSMLAVDGSVIFRQQASGAIILCTFPRLPADAQAGPPPVPSDRVAEALQRLAAVVPALAGVPVARVWSGVEGYLPDMLPVLGRSRTTPGLLHAFGFSGHGFQLAPGVGAVIADLVAEGRTDTRIDAYDIGRFARGVTPDDRIYREFDPSQVGSSTQMNTGDQDARPVR